MRALILLLPLAVAFAEGDSPLEQATNRWTSDSAEERDAASRFVAIHLRRELAPLVAALQSADPEVRRRARSALEALLPPRPPEPPVQEEHVLAGQVIILNNVPVGGGALQVNARGQAVLVDMGEARQLKAKGLVGMPVDDPVMREQLVLAEGRGFAVSAVDPRSDAERLGILANDILLSIGGRPVKQAADVGKALEARAPGITLLRRGKLMTLPEGEGEGAAGEGK